MKYNEPHSGRELDIHRHIPIVMNKEVAEIIQYCIKHRIFYGVFPTVGDSMTCNDERSIPEGSGVLAYDLQLDMRRPLFDLANLIPLDQPVLISLYDKRMGHAFLLKTISIIDMLSNRIRLTPYNQRPEYEGWVSCSKVLGIYKVLQVIPKESMDAELKNDRH